jgi:hypothetical protein
MTRHPIRRNALYLYITMLERRVYLSALFELVGELQVSARITLIWFSTHLRSQLVLLLHYYLHYLRSLNLLDIYLSQLLGELRISIELSSSS